ncbi:hypothetical protein ABW19_dt0208656 [Dactylella cylindrospora]|nr:hypothetical protein ABW19_dt0208656 [Dactylella cylindrospora]
MHISTLFPVLAILGIASATEVLPAENTNCWGNVGPINACGCTNMGANFRIRSAYTIYQGQTAQYFAQRGCVGAQISIGSNQCLAPPWERIGSVNIVC